MTTTDGRGDVGFDVRVAGPAEPTVGPTVEGDDIEVLPEPAQPGSRRRVRALIVGAVVVVLAAAAITAGVVSRHHSASGANSLSSVSRVATHTPSRPKSHVAPKHPAVKAHAKPHRSTHVGRNGADDRGRGVSCEPAHGHPVDRGTRDHAAGRVAVGAHVAVGAGNARSQGRCAHDVHRDREQSDRRDRDARRSALVHADARDRTRRTDQQRDVRADGAGALAASDARPAVHGYATSTGDASGTPLAAGRYIVRVENVYSIPVTVTAS